LLQALDSLQRFFPPHARPPAGQQPRASFIISRLDDRVQVVVESMR